MKKIFLPIIALVLIATSCSDDRVTPDEFKSLNGFYEKYREETQSVTITSDEGELPIIGKKGTELYGTRHILQHANGDSVQLPWVVQLIELYSIKDHLLYQHPTLENNVTPIESEGTIKVLAYALQEELEVRAGKFFVTKLTTETPQTGMTVYSGGATPDTFIEWSQASDGSTNSIDAGKHQLNLATLGWSQLAGATYGSTTTATFTLTGTGGENIDLWAVPTTKKSLIYGNNLTLPNLPVGETVTIFGLALNQNDKLVMHNATVVVTDGMVIELELKETSESDVLSLLESL